MQNSTAVRPLSHWHIHRVMYLRLTVSPESLAHLAWLCSICIHILWEAEAFCILLGAGLSPQGRRQLLQPFTHGFFQIICALQQQQQAEHQEPYGKATTKYSILMHKCLVVLPGNRECDDCGLYGCCCSVMSQPLDASDVSVAASAWVRSHVLCMKNAHKV